MQDYKVMCVRVTGSSSNSIPTVGGKKHWVGPHREQVLRRVTGSQMMKTPEVGKRLKVQQPLAITNV